MRFLFIVLFIGLTACVKQHSEPSTTHHHKPKFSVPTSLSQSERYAIKQDFAPSGAPPKTFKTIKPKNEPLSRYGNPDSYKVDGRTYSVLTSASGYKARGMASWYASKFHNQRTSSGEHYDMYALTAAHRTLPLPSYLKVKNLKNGRVVVVKVNDRGPFHSGRIIDLSYGAAAKLGIFPSGTAPVEIEALTVPSKKAKHVAHYYLQAGAFNSRQLANALKAKLSKITPSPVFIETYKHRYVVQVGPFATRSMTNRLKNKLQSKGIKGAFSLIR